MSYYVFCFEYKNGVRVNGYSPKIDAGYDVIDNLKIGCDYTLYVFDSMEEYFKFSLRKFLRGE